MPAQIPLTIYCIEISNGPAPEISRQMMDRAMVIPFRRAQSPDQESRNPHGAEIIFLCSGPNQRQFCAFHSIIDVDPTGRRASVCSTIFMCARLTHISEMDRIRHCSTKVEFELAMRPNADCFNECVCVSTLSARELLAAPEPVRIDDQTSSNVNLRIAPIPEKGTDNINGPPATTVPNASNELLLLGPPSDFASNRKHDSFGFGTL